MFEIILWISQNIIVTNQIIASFIYKWVSKDIVNHLEDVIFPALLNRLHVDVVSVDVVHWNVCKAHFDLA